MLRNMRYTTSEQDSIARLATLTLVVTAGSKCRRRCAGDLRVSRFGGVRDAKRHFVLSARIAV